MKKSCTVCGFVPVPIASLGEWPGAVPPWEPILHCNVDQRAEFDAMIKTTNKLEDRANGVIKANVQCELDASLHR